MMMRSISSHTVTFTSISLTYLGKNSLSFVIFELEWTRSWSKRITTVIKWLMSASGTILLLVKLFTSVDGAMTWTEGRDLISEFINNPPA